MVCRAFHCLLSVNRALIISEWYLYSTVSVQRKKITLNESWEGNQMNKRPQSSDICISSVSTETKAAAGDTESVCELTPPWCINVSRVKILFLLQKQTALVDLNLCFSLSLSFSRCFDAASQRKYVWHQEHNKDLRVTFMFHGEQTICRTETQDTHDGG